MRSYPPASVAHPRPEFASSDNIGPSALAQRSRFLPSLLRAVLVLLGAVGLGGMAASRVANAASAPAGSRLGPADATELWSWQPIHAAIPPVPKGKAWVKNPI